MDDTTEKFAFLGLGWLFGILSPIMTNAIVKQRENIAGRRAIRGELRDVSHALVTSYEMIKRHFAETTRDDFVWMKKHLESHASFTDSSKMLAFVNQAIQANEVELRTHVLQAKSKPGTALELSTFPVPLLDSRVSALWSFDTNFQRTLLQIRANIRQLDKLAANAEKYFDQTFNDMEPANRLRVDANYTMTVRKYADTAKAIVDLVDTIERN